MRSRTPTIYMPYSIAVGIAVAAVYLGWVYPALSHDAPTGWSYPFACCSNMDCREVGDSHSQNATIRIFETDKGYRISSTDEVIGYTDKRIKDSPDGEFHWCSVAGHDDSRTICLFVPTRGF